MPEFAHVPMILGSDGSRLSKRHGALNLLAYRDEGFLPEALLNYIVRLGWSNGDQEIFSVEEMIDLFELKNINNSPASFNQEKLEWINQSYIKSTDINNLVENLKWHLNNLNINLDNGPSIYELADSLRERSGSLVDMAQSCVMFYCDFDTFDSVQANKVFNTKSRPILESLVVNLNSVDSWTAERIHSVIKIVCEKHYVGFGKVGQPFRLALSGDGKSGSIDISAQFVGRDRTLARLEKAIDWVNNPT